MARIIIIDDASFMRNTLKYIVEAMGHEVVALAASGEEGVELYKKHTPDLVTMDLVMAKMDGLTALKLIREKDPKAKVIIVSALGTENKRAEAGALGAAGYIRKPFKADEVTAEINRALGGSGG